MDSASEIPRHLRLPGDEGYRTPTIEDTENSVNQWPYLSNDFAQLQQIPSIGEIHANTLDAINRLAYRTKSRDADGSVPTVKLRTRSSQGSSEVRTESEIPDKLSVKQRVRHLTWAFFTLTMATGGIANVLYSVPDQYRFRGLDIIGTVVFLINIVFYIVIWGLILVRFICFPYTFKASFLHPTESLFVPATVVSFGTILINISQYGLGRTGPWLVEAVRVLFWFDATLAIILSAGIYLLLWSTQTFTIAQMTPIWIFPAYPMLIIGTHAGVLSAHLDPRQSLYIIVGGFTIQGIGFLVSLMVYSAFIYRLMTQKLPRENIRPGMFVSVGPSAFTVTALINMAFNAPRAFPSDFMGDGALAAMVVKVVANFCSLWLWGLAVFFFIIATVANLYGAFPGRMVFSMSWFSFVFPNTALITATFAVGNAFSCKPILILGLVMTLLLIPTYLFVCYMMIRAIKLRHILWPQKGEDKDEGGFRAAQVQQNTDNGRA